MPRVQEVLKTLVTELPESVVLVAVSKTRPLEAILEAYRYGQRVFGENRPQELKEKAGNAPEDILWHMIGHLQTNKVKYIIDHVQLIHSVDSVKLMDEIQKRAVSVPRSVDVLLQVHIAQEEEKYGFNDEELREILNPDFLREYPNVRVRGLMGMATFTKDEIQIRSEFKGLRTAFESYQKSIGEHFDTLSMGMSGDYQVAIEEGSTMVRVGSYIFGPRKNT